MRIVARWPEPHALTTEAQHVGGVAIHDRQLVRDEEDGQSLLPLQPGHQLVQTLLPRFIDAGRRLVEEEHIRIADERERHEQTLELSTRDRADRLFAGLARHAHQVQRPSNGCARLPGERRARPQEVSAGNGDVSLEIELLWDVPDPGPGNPLDGAVTRDRTDEGSEQHGLAGCVWSEDGERGAALDAEAHIAQNCRLSESNGKMTDV